MTHRRTDEEWEQLVERVTREGPIPLCEAARLVPRSVRRKTGGRRHSSAESVRRWILDGLDGVYLDGCRLHGEAWYTSRQAVRRFQAALSRKAAAARVPLVAGTVREREAAHAAADRELVKEIGE